MRTTRVARELAAAKGRAANRRALKGMVARMKGILRPILVLVLSDQTETRGMSRRAKTLSMAIIALRAAIESKYFFRKMGTKLS